MKPMFKSAKKVFAAAACMSLLLVCFASCNQPNGGKTQKPTEQSKSSEKKLMEFKFEKANNADAGLKVDVIGIVNEEKKTVEIEVPSGTDKTKLKATFKISDKAKLFIGTVEQKSGETVNDFSNITDGVKLTVKAEDGTTQEYTVRVSTETKLMEFKFEKANNADAGLSKNVKGRVNEKNHSVTIEVPFGTDKTKLKASFKISDKTKLFIGTVEQKSGETVNDFSNITDGVKLTVKAEDGTTQEYTVKVYVEIRIFTFGFKKADNTPAISEDVDAAFCGFLKGRGVIIIKLPVGTTEESLKTLKPSFGTSPDVELFVKDTKLENGMTPVDFSEIVDGTTTEKSWGATIVAKASDGGSLTYTAVVEVDLPKAEKKDIQKYSGSYYGNLDSPYLGKNKVVVVLEEKKVTMYSTAMSMDYVNVEWEKKPDNTYTCTTYKKGKPQIKGMFGKGSYDFIEEGGKIIVKSNIMGTPVTLTKGEAFVWKEGSEYKPVTMNL